VSSCAYDEDVTEESEARRRFLTVEQVSEEPNVGVPQIRALLKSGELRGIQVGGQWRIGANDIEDYADAVYRRTAECIAAGELKDEGDQEE
jgi:excisionase family DNA binding protein